MLSDIQKATLAKVSLEIEKLLDNNQKGKIIIYITESGIINAEVIKGI